MDKIYINDLEFVGYHGVFPEEKKLGQKFLVSVEILADVREAGITGNLEKSIHYGHVAADIEKIFSKKSYNLIETCAEKIAMGILRKYELVQEIKVLVKKPWAPIQMHFKEVAVEIIRKKYLVYLSLGSNIGNKSENIGKAIEKLQNYPDINVNKKSTIIETKPFGPIIQEDFLNCCIEVETILLPAEFLDIISIIEKEMGRERTKEIKWGPRTIDIDIILYGKEIVEKDNLSIPHQWMSERSFVLDPLSEIAPNVIHPLLNKSIFQLKRELDKEN